MPGFRCNMLDAQGGTLFFADIVAESLPAATGHAFDILHMSNKGSLPTSSYVYAFEVWLGGRKLYTESLAVPVASQAHSHSPEAASHQAH